MGEISDKVFEASDIEEVVVKDVSELINVFGTITSIFMYVAIMFATLSIILILVFRIVHFQYLTIPAMRLSLDTFIPDFINNPLERAEFIINELAEVADEKLSELIKLYREASENNDTYEILNAAAGLEEYYSDWLKKKEEKHEE